MCVSGMRLLHCIFSFAVTCASLADRTNGRAYATVLRLSVRLSVVRL